MLERDFQAELIKELRQLFEGCEVLITDPNYIQGIPDLIILYKDKWAALECKLSAKSKQRPNQHYYVSKMDDMSFAAFIYPENKGRILNELQQAFGTRR